MSTKNSARLLERISEVSRDIAELRRVRMEIATSGTSSATLSSGGGSKSFTRLDLNTLNSLITDLVHELNALRTRLSGGSPIRRIQFVRSAW